MLIFFPGYGDLISRVTGDGNPDHVARLTAVNPVKQRLYRLLVPDAILNPPVHWLRIVKTYSPSPLGGEG